MRLVVFDLDSALCPTSTMDSLAMAKAIKDVADCHLEPESIDSVLDLKGLWYRVSGRVATAIEIAELRARFFFHLRREFLIRPSVVTANYSFIEYVNNLQNRDRVVIGLVSASSASVVLLKARTVGLITDGLTLATGEDADHFEGILKTLKTRVKRSYGFQPSDMTLVGSEEWEDAASKVDMTRVSPSNFLAEKVAPRFETSRKPFFSRFNWAQS